MTPRVGEAHLDALPNQSVVVLRDEPMDAAFEEHADQRVDDVITLHEMDPGPPVGQRFEAMLALGADHNGLPIV